ncbi:hypothetical protein EV360DRAFT_96576 [Lentinula raphanica]|nr:hypothetical protein EV360DRAFT_96576 [Lentinula raphanica]
MASAGQLYGACLPDQVDRISATIDAHIQLVADVREMYKDRVALEREFATKLQALAKRSAEKKSKMESVLVLGGDPTKAWDESTLKQSTLNSAYESIIASLVNAAQDHNNIADTLTTQVVDALKTAERRHESYQKTEAQFYQKLISERDRAYSERLKYDEECGEVEGNRQKQGRANDDKHAERIARQIEQQRIDMFNSKNAYIIATAIANKTKDKFYNMDLVQLENTLQTRLVNKFTKILVHAQALQISHLDVLKNRLAGNEAKLNEIAPSKDEDLYIEYNVRPFSPPGDWKFEPCATFYDTGEMCVEPDPKTVLQNRLRRSRDKLQELIPMIDSKQREHDQLGKLAVAYDGDHSLGNVEDISDVGLFPYPTTICSASDRMTSPPLPEDVGVQQPHNFKSSSFSIPTTCGYCKTSIWGLSKQGKTCRVCGLSVHAKCEIKVPADCQRGGGGVSRHSSRLSTSSRLSAPATSSRSTEGATPTAPTASSFVHSVPKEEEEPYTTAKVLFDFNATSEFEISVSEGATVTVIEHDDGSGWVKVNDGSGDGLVPASYLEHDTGQASDRNERGSGQYVKAIYTYEAQGSDELGLKDGELIELSSGPSGGQYYGEGWWEGESDP